MFLLLIFASSVLLVTYITICHKRKWKALSVIPGPPAYPIIGHLNVFLGSLEDVTQKLKQAMCFNERMVRIWAGPFNLICIVNARDAEIIFKNSRDIDKAPIYQYWKPIVGDSLFTSNTDARFKRNRKLVLPSLALNNVKEFFDSFNKHSDDLVKILSNKTGLEFNIGDDLSICILNTLLETVLGYNREDLQMYSKAIMEASDRFGSYGALKTLKYWLRIDFISWLLGHEGQIKKDIDFMTKVSSQIIEERRRNRKQNDHTTVFIDALLDARDENGPCLSIKEIINEIITIIFAGQDTVSTALGISLCLLGLHKEPQDKLYKEVVSKLDKDDCYVTYDVIKELQYLNRVVQETLRLYPSAPVVGKVALNDVDLGEQILPKGTVIAVSLFHIHRNRNDYHDPEKFDPDNFLSERISSRHPYSYIPFSSGNRTCIGQIYSHLLIKMILAKIVFNFRIHSRQLEENSSFSFGPTIKRSDGFLVILEPRNNIKV